MMIKYFGNPSQEVKSKSTGKIMFRFDTKGEFITDDDVIIRRCSGFFDSQEIKVDESETKERVKKVHTVPAIKIETKQEVEAREAQEKQVEESEEAEVGSQEKQEPIKTQTKSPKRK